MTKFKFPKSVWRGNYRSKVDLDKFLIDTGFGKFARYHEDRLLFTRHPFTFPAYCVSCENLTNHNVSYSALDNSSAHPAWTETFLCEGCGLNSRARAVIDFMLSNFSNDKSIYIAERITPFYSILNRYYPSLTGSEYIDQELNSGAEYPVEGHGQVVHQDLTHLSFSDASFDVVITRDVFEHVPDYLSAFREIHRVLRSGGSLVFTIPFFSFNDSTIIRASVDDDGDIVHHHPPEIHGNPMEKKGSLCFQNFGWDIIVNLKASNFSDAYGAMYWGPERGHLGLSFFVFCAHK